jgi:hypothetical protein
MYKRPYKSWRAKTIKEKSTENITDFSQNKVLYILRKPHVPHTIVFIEDKDDPWFVYVKYFKTKTGVISDSSMIIAGDVEIQLTHLLDLGYEIQK